MPVFTYTARDTAGNLTNGTVEADSNSLAVSLLRDQGLWVTDLRLSGSRERQQPAAPHVPRDDSLTKRVRSPVPLKDLAVYYRQLYTLLQSGVSVFSALEMLSQSGQTSNQQLRRIIGEMSQQLLKGTRLSDSMQRYPWLFDRLQVRMVEAGEQGGLLPEVVRRLAEYLEREFQVRMELKRKTLYPKLVLLLLFFVLPINTPLTLNGYLGDISRQTAWTLGVGIPLWLVFRLFVTSQAGAEFFDQVKLLVPVIGPLVRKTVAARYARCLAALYGAGVPIRSAVQMSGEASANHLLQRETRKVIPALERGIPLSQCLQSTGFFPVMFLGMVSTGESTGNLDVMLDKAADFYEEESSHASSQLVIILGVVLLVIVGILVFFKILSFYTGLFGGVMNAAGMGAGGGE